MEGEVLKYVIEGGVGLAAIVIVFLFYRADTLKRDKSWQEHCQMLRDILADKRELIKSDQESREEHIKVLTELATLLKGLNGKVAEIIAERALEERRHL
jgi:hypothetical protein